MNFYSPVSNTRCHSIGHKIRIARIKIRVDSPGRWERAYGRNAILKSCVLSLERNIGEEDEFLVSGGSEFQSRGPTTEKALLPNDDQLLRGLKCLNSRTIQILSSQPGISTVV